MLEEIDLYFELRLAFVEFPEVRIVSDRGWGFNSDMAYEILGPAGAYRIAWTLSGRMGYPSRHLRAAAERAAMEYKLGLMRQRAQRRRDVGRSR